MKDFVVHSIPGSPFGRAVVATLEEKGVPYRFAAFAPQDIKASRHFALHPFGRVPILEHGDFRLYETQAILRYIDRVAPKPALTPVDPQSAGRMDQVMNINDWYLFQGAGAVIGFQRIVGPKFRGLQPDETAIATALPKAQLAFDELARLLGANTYLAGGDLSLADLLVAPQIDFLTMTPEWSALIRSHSNLQAWHAHMMERPCMQATTWERVMAMAKAAALPKAS